MKNYILVVEDDANILELIEFLLTTKGFAVWGVSTVKMLWAAIDQRIPDVILLDVMLPDGNGMDECLKLKADLATSHIPVILMSAHFNTRQHKIDTGGRDFISKPFDIDRLLTAVERQLA